jgi:hypothetical protein
VNLRAYQNKGFRSRVSDKRRHATDIIRIALRPPAFSAMTLLRAAV